ncbi:MAG: hypothetical protein ABI681_08395 [Gemmatimonadales bacterium]
MIRAYPARAFLLWIALHAFVAVGSGAGIVAFSTSASLALTVIAAAVGFFDSRRRHEYTLLGNLGIPALAPPAMWAGTILVLEILLRAMTAIAGGSPA